MASIQGIYVALFGRPADPAGLQYFNTATNNGANLNAIGDLAATAEYQDRFKGMDNASIVTAIYQSLFGRNPELAGLTFFVDALNKGTININNVAINILDGAKGDDLATVNNKITAANAFTAAIDTPDELAAYRGDAAADAGRSFLSPITSDDATIPSATATDAALAAIVTGVGPGGPGDIFTLTAAGAGVSGNDNLVGTSGDDNFRAVDNNSLSSSDQLDGKGGFNTLNITDGAINGGTAAPVLKNIALINNSDGTSTLDFSASTGVQKVVSIAANGETFTYKSADQAVTFGSSGLASGEAHTVEIQYASKPTDATVAHLAVNDAAGANTTFLFSGTGQGAALKHVSLDLESSAAGTATFGAELTKLDSIAVTGAGHGVVAIDAASQLTLTKFDASANTGGVSFTADLAKDASILGGSGTDTFNFNGVAVGKLTISTGDGNDQVSVDHGTDTIDLGAGNDVVNIGGGEHKVTLGAGNDTVVVTAAAASTVAAFSTIADFASGNDKIDLSAVGAIAAAAGNQQAVDALHFGSGDTLADAVAAVKAVTAANETVSFHFGENTYVYSDNASDTLIELTGNVTVHNSDFVF